MVSAVTEVPGMLTSLEFWKLHFTYTRQRRLGRDASTADEFASRTSFFAQHDSSKRSESLRLPQGRLWRTRRLRGSVPRGA
jgi:hypothetical protein